MKNKKTAQHIIATLTLIASAYSTLGFASTSLPEYYITGTHTDTTGFFSDNLYVEFGSGIDLWNGMKQQNISVILNDNGDAITQSYQSETKKIIPHIDFGTGWQINFGHRIGNRLGLSASTNLSSSSTVKLTSGTRNLSYHYKLPLTTHSYSFMVDDNIYWEAFGRNLFKFAPYISSGAGISLNSAKLDTSSVGNASLNPGAKFAVDIKPEKSSKASFAWHLGGGLGFFFQPSQSFRFGQLFAIGYDYINNGSLKIDYNHTPIMTNSVQGDPLELKLAQQRISMTYSLTF